MDDERTRLIQGLVLYGLGVLYCGVALWWYTKGYAAAGIERLERDPVNGEA